MGKGTTQGAARSVALALAAPSEGRARTPGDMGAIAQIAADAVWKWAGEPRVDVTELWLDLEEAVRGDHREGLHESGAGPYGRFDLCRICHDWED